MNITLLLLLNSVQLLSRNETNQSTHCLMFIIDLRSVSTFPFQKLMLVDTCSNFTSVQLPICSQNQISLSLGSAQKGTQNSLFITKGLLL